MVQKIKFTVLFLLIFVLCFLSLNSKNKVEVNLVKTLLPQSVNNSDDIITVLNGSSSVIKVVFEAGNEDELIKITDSFINQIDKNYFNYAKADTSELIKKYLSKPNNFLSVNTKNILIKKEYDKVRLNSLNMLYNPVGMHISPVDKDPYLLLDDYLLSNAKLSDKKNYFENKYYDCIILKIESKEALSPDLSNRQISELVKLTKKLQTKTTKIYLAGTPVHSYYTSIKSIISINVICILSTILIVFLTYFYFRSLKPLIPVVLSISFGMLAGFCAVKLWFSNFQIITMVFSTALIGIGIDYSYHYFFSDVKGEKFVKNLTFSFLTTVIPFLLLYLSGIELLKQVSIFTIFGLFGVYSVVLFIYPEFNAVKPKKTIKLNLKFYKIAFIMIIILSAFGLLRLRFNDSLSALYTPSKKLLKAEILYNKISGENFEKAKAIIVKGNNIPEIIKNEEKIIKILSENNIEYISLSKIIPSKDIQKENFELVKKLYNANLDKFKDILTSQQISVLKKQKFSPVEFEIKDYPFLKDFMPDNHTSLIFAFSDENLSKSSIKIVDFKSDIEKYLKKYRVILLLMFPAVIIILYIILSFLYNFKSALKMLLPSVIGITGALLVTSLIMGEVNLFGVIAIFLVTGFTMDYSIFRNNGEDKTEDAVLISFLTTSFSFLLLSLCAFKLLSSISLILFFGITISYITGKLILLKQNN